MKVTIKRADGTNTNDAKRKKIDLLDFGESQNLELEIVEFSNRNLQNGMKWRASFKGVEIMERSILRCASGRGMTINSALKNYAKEISEQRLVFGAHSNHRAEFNAPVLTYKSREEYNA